MAAGSPEKLHYELKETTQTNERSIILWVRESYFTASTQTVEGTTLANFMATENVPKGDLIDLGFGSYVLSRALPKSGSCLRFAFGKPKTSTDLATPLSTTENWTTITWPAILQNLYGGAATRLLSMESGYGGTADWQKLETFFIDRYVKIPETTASTRILIEEWTSPTRFTDLREETLNPTVVAYNFSNERLELNCLHDDVFVPKLFASFQRFQDFGTPNAVELSDGLFFPATNPATWRPFFYRDRQEFVDTVWVRTRVTAYPPPLPEGQRL